jgi:hypothetical protein
MLKHIEFKTSLTLIKFYYLIFLFKLAYQTIWNVVVYLVLHFFISNL